MERAAKSPPSTVESEVAAAALRSRLARVLDAATSARKAAGEGKPIREQLAAKTRELEAARAKIRDLEDELRMLRVLREPEEWQLMLPAMPPLPEPLIDRLEKVMELPDTTAECERDRMGNPIDHSNPNRPR